MLEELLHFVGRMGHWGYLVVFITVTLECAAIFFLPGETLVVIGGVFAAHGELELGTLIGVVSVGAILGYTIGFEIGHRVGRVQLQNIGRRFGLREKHFNRVDSFFARYGGRAVFLGRFTSFMRAFVCLAAGSSKMPYRRFLLFNIAGGIVWSASFTLLGYFIGGSLKIAELWMGDVSLLVALIVLVVGATVWLNRDDEQ
jgi:undecaprenyl-diphosphatase